MWKNFPDNEDTKLIESLGDGDINCRNDLNYNSNFIFTSDSIFDLESEIVVDIYTNKNIVDCSKEIEVAANFGLSTIFGACSNFPTGIDNKCQFICCGLKFYQIRIFPLKDGLALCEISLSSPDRFVNVCI